MKKYFCALFFLFCFNLIFAVQTSSRGDSVKTYRQAKEYYDNNEFGKALKYAEDAIYYKKQQAEYENKVLKASLSAKRVIAAGTKITDVLKVLEKRDEEESIKIINTYIKRKSIDFFENDINKLVSFINENSVYPEAQKLIGDVYKIEGEYDFAEQYYLTAYENKDILDVPDEKFDILYMLSDLSRLRNDENQMETRLLNIIAEDVNFRDEALFNAMMNTVKTNTSASVEKYFTLYRADSYYSLDAYNQLKDYYFSKGETEKALRFSALSTITGFTKIIKIISKRNINYEYTDLNEFFQEASFYPDVVSWGQTNNVWKSFNDLAMLTKAAGINNFSAYLYKSIAQYIPDTYWQKNAVLALSEE